MEMETKTNKTDDFMQKITAVENAFKTLLCGQWWYEGSVKNLNSAILEWLPQDMKKNENMPKKLFLSNENSGTDLKDSLYYNKDYLGLNSTNEEFGTFFLDRGNELVVYPTKVRNRDIPAKDLVYHIYKKHGCFNYTKNDIRTILDKLHKEDEFTIKAPLSKNFYGHYEMYDEILESDISTYTGKIKTEDACYVLSPLFDILDLTADGAYILKEDDTINIKFDEKNKKTLTRSNTLLQTYMHDTNKNIFGAYDPQTLSNYTFELKTIGNKQYLFANLNFNRDADETIYVFVKTGEVKTPKKVATPATKAVNTKTKISSQKADTKTSTKPTTKTSAKASAKTKKPETKTASVKTKPSTITSANQAKQQKECKGFLWK